MLCLRSFSWGWHLCGHLTRLDWNLKLLPDTGNLSSKTIKSSVRRKTLQLMSLPCTRSQNRFSDCKCFYSSVPDTSSASQMESSKLQPVQWVTVTEFGFVHKGAYEAKVRNLLWLHAALCLLSGYPLVLDASELVFWDLTRHFLEAPFL